MPLGLLRFLPQIGIALAIIGSVWWIDHRGYARAVADRDARDAALLDRMRSDLRQSEQRIALRIDEIADDYEARRAALARTGALLRPIVIGETEYAPRLADPSAGLTPGLLDAVNRARATGPCAAAATGLIACALPAVIPDQGTGHR
jgi:hypothetical protein